MQHLPRSYEEATPSDALLAQVIRCRPQELGAMVGPMPEAQRAGLAVFCHARAHLREHGRAIAATCSRAALTGAGGLAGASLFDQLQQPAAAPGAGGRQPVRPVSVARSARPAM